MLEPRKVDKPLVLYGNGRLARLALEIFDSLGLKPTAVLDGWRWGDKESVSDGIKRDALIAICIASEPYVPLLNMLRAAAWRDVVPVWDIIEAYPEVNIRNGWFLGELSIKEKEFVRRLSWGDDLSGSHYASFLAWRKSHMEMRYRPYDGIHTYPSTLRDVRMRQYVHRMSREALKTSSEWDIHAEGFELETLERNMRSFAEMRPTLRVACYHSRDGAFAIPQLLMESLEDYVFTFRLTAYMGQGAYIICTPQEDMK